MLALTPALFVKSLVSNCSPGHLCPLLGTFMLSARRRRIVLKNDVDLRPFCKMLCDGFYVAGKRDPVVRACTLSYETHVGDFKFKPTNQN